MQIGNGTVSIAYGSMDWIPTYVCKGRGLRAHCKTNVHFHLLYRLRQIRVQTSAPSAGLSSSHSSFYRRKQLLEFLLTIEQSDELPCSSTYRTQILLWTRKQLGVFIAKKKSL